MTEQTPTNATLDLLPDTSKLRRFSKLLALALSVAALGSGIATYIALTGSSSPYGPDPGVVTTLVLVNLVLLVVLFTFILRHIMLLRRSLRQGSVGSRLQTRIVLVFCLVTILPTIIVSVFSALFFNFGIKSWFHERVTQALNESAAVAESYLNEHQEMIKADAIAMAADIKRDLPLIVAAPGVFREILNNQVGLRNLTEAVVLQPSRAVARSDMSFAYSFDRLPQQVLDEAELGNVVVITDEDDKIQGVIKLDEASGYFLVVSRLVDPKVINHMVLARGAVNEYRKLQSSISDIQIQFSVIFILVALLLLLAAIWYGMYVALRLVVPIARLINAAERVRAGDYDIRVPEGSAKDEIGNLSRTFNRMTQQLEKQRAELIDANRQLDERRRLTEAVFAGVSAGVLALNPQRNVALHNRSAALLLGYEENASLKKLSIETLLPAAVELLDQCERKPDRLVQKDVMLSDEEGKQTFHVTVAAERNEETLLGFVVTFDDITELMSAQRSAAWADVARRIAHEIKNPLTPITLSAERLRKKYAEEITSDREAFLRYTDTIAKNVKDIGRMVEEFVNFARMPAAVFRSEDMAQLVRKTVFSEKTAHANIRYSVTVAEEPLMLVCDERQVRQLLTNLLKNAAEALESTTDPAISVSVYADPDSVTVDISDNGTGFPADKIATLTEPYVTTRAKGTGLGLAIVKKSMEEHKGSIVLANQPESGAKVTLVFSRNIQVDLPQK